MTWRRLVTFRTLYLLFLGVHVPITQSSFTYLFLALVYGSIFLYRGQKLLIPWYWYLVLGFVDVLGNYFFIKAFQFTSITSVTLLDCWTIAWVIILTWLLLNTQYSLFQLFGAALCVLGLVLVLLSDVGVGREGGSRPLLGDTLVVVATFFYALSNTGEEFCVKKKDRVEVLYMLGVYGLFVSLVEISIVEVKSLQSIKWSADIILAFSGFALSSFVFYSLTPYVLELSGATMFNLSLLTSDMWAVIIHIFLYHQQVDWLYYLAFAIVSIGLIIYSTSEKDSAQKAGNYSAQYHIFSNDNEASRDESISS